MKTAKLLYIAIYLEFSENSQGRKLKAKITYFLSEVLDMSEA